ncbi:MAG: phospholipase D-like domain-containing protein [Usitatibacter sp.]
MQQRFAAIVVRLAAGAVALVLAGCAVAPLDRYLLQPEPRQAQIEGARGVLTRAQSRKIIEGLKDRSPDSALLQGHIAIEEALAGNPLSIGNKVTLLEDGKATFTSMLAAIAAAKHHVHMETYIIEDDDVGKVFAEALKKRAAAGVKVRLMYDSVGSVNTDKAYFKDLQDNGVDVVEFNPVSVTNVLKDGLRIQNRDHRKLIVVDGRVAFLGGINISGVYGSAGIGGNARRSGSAASGSSGGGGGISFSGSGAGTGKGKDPDYDRNDPPFDQRPWRDLQVRIEGPVVGDLQRAFLRQWEKWAKQSFDDKAFFPQLKNEGPQVVRAMAGSPSEKGVDASYVALISAIESADVEVAITNAYFVPHPLLRKALVDAARRGVDVKLILPGHSDNRLVFHAGRSYYEELLEAGVKIFERQTRFLHSKSAMIDGVWSTVGSTNLDWRSLIYNDELNLVVMGPDFAARIGEVFAKDLANSRQVTLEDWHKRPISDRLKEVTARAWAYFL